LHGQARRMSYQLRSFVIGLFDEGLAVEGGSFLREGDEELVNKLERFNRTQDYNILDRICAI